MNPNWKNFLLSQQAEFLSPTDIHFSDSLLEQPLGMYAVVDLAVLTVSGNDAATLLQGQMTCNVYDISESQSSIAAMCTPKGRVIATFLLIKAETAFHLVLPVELLETVKKRLQMYVLRSKVTIGDNSETLCLIGTHSPATPAQTLFATNQSEDVISINLSSSQARYLQICTADKAVELWLDYVAQGFKPQSIEQWRYLDIVSGIPWLCLATSEMFIPQMLNLDELGGISYNKGCYTGQEIVARTHYLGQAKRALFLAECASLELPLPDARVVDASHETVGKVLQASKGKQGCLMLIVLQLNDVDTRSLQLIDTLTPVTLLSESSS